MITDPAVIDELIRQFHFLQCADADFVRHFFASTKIIHLPADEPICPQGMQCSHLALVIEGTARIYKIGENGREITLYRIGPGESCILTASCIMSQKPFPAFAVSEQPIQAVIISTSDVVRWSNSEQAWRDYLFRLISERLSDVISVVEEVAFRRVDRRLAGYLLQNTDNGSNRMQVTHQSIASDLGTSREVVSRILKDFEQQGLISITRGAITLEDRDHLNDKSTE
ncbi:MAG: Crp/Fnr family transcriptional regulator [Candidatus Thiodiazotropha endolucinida]|nr:Crp/Fnr family transcriptional regulator [Candidatus Thiodiazotropha taylori]MCG8095501.1 Crp/Fnr family transcriptional regulator [Candidatus Thiodiazotropha endolucinida]MCG8060209.1 Crp/Fnr family transcriptional regulator [Candidatus Thiodiazotropha taylori]MCG8062724.1 Crp/Fnr family transcriptional regulator [Candidatus Thiodiazotropha taylori]MCW4328801.1 Crp/Fnr family transcriptional regulator [Candidatus Thiodiazotropha endolucinida]